MKKQITIILCMMMTLSLSCINVHAEETNQGNIVTLDAENSEKVVTNGKCGENVNWSVSNNILTISGTGPMNNIELYRFESYEWDSLKDTITKVVVSKGVTYIGHYAFCGFTNLKSVSIADSVTELGHDVFGGCDSLKSISIPNSVTKIGSLSFANCRNLTNVKLPNKLKEIASDLFNSSTSLETLEIPSTVTSIGFQAFAGCEKLKNIVIPSKVTTIGGWSFYQCKNLTNINVPNGVTILKEGTFSDCTNVKSITVPNSVKVIDESVFAGCTNLTSLVIPEGVTTLGNYAFYDDTNLKTISLPHSLTTIGQSAFDKVSATLNVYYGSAAHKFARDNKLSYKVIDLVSVSKLSITANSVTYAGKAIRPTITVKNGNTVLKEETNYTVEYVANKNNKNVGIGYIKVKGRGRYTGSKTVTYKILPQKVTQYAPVSGKKAIQVKYKKLSKVSGYQITYQEKGSKTWKSVTTSETSKKLTGLKSKKYYNIKVRGYKTVGKTKYYGSYSTVKTVKTK